MNEPHDMRVMSHIWAVRIIKVFWCDRSCSVVQCVAVCCGVLRCGAVCCGVLQCVAVSCSVLQCVTCVIHIIQVS